MDSDVLIISIWITRCPAPLSVSFSISAYVCEYMCVCLEPRKGANCISCSSAGSQMPLYRTPTSEIHPQEWRLHLRRLATGHPALPLSQKPLSVKLASFGFSLGNFRWIVHVSTGCLGADGAEKTAPMCCNAKYILQHAEKKWKSEANLHQILTAVKVWDHKS